MKVFVKFPGGRESPISVKDSCTIQDVKGVIQGIYGIKPSEQSLVLRNRILEDHHTLDDYGIIKESTIHVVAQLKSGYEIAAEKPEAREVVLPGCIIGMKVLEQFLREHVDSCARVEQSSDPDVVGIVVVNTDKILSADQLREIISTSNRVSEKELEAWVAEYCDQQQQREAEFNGDDTGEQRARQPWINLLSCGQLEREGSENIQSSTCDINPVEYSDEGLQDHWIHNRTAVDCEVRLSRESPAHRTVARIDSMSDGCFISPKLQAMLQATPDEAKTCAFQCPKGILETKGIVKLLVYWRDSEQQINCAKVHFNCVPEYWNLQVDMIVTTPMASAIGLDKIARGVPRDNMLAANERIFGRISFRRQDKKAKVETDIANAIKAQQNLKDEAEWLQKHEMLRHPSQPCPGRPIQIPAT